jgi:predicted TIM-barrel fold metal-dependent hydrolase
MEEDVMFDSHVHLGSEEWVHDCVGIYGQSISEYFGKTMVPESVESMTERYRQLGLRAVLLGWDAERSTGQAILPNARIAEIQSQYPDVYVGIGSVDPHRSDAIERVREVRRLGLRGLKLHPSVQEFDPLDPNLASFFEAVAEERLPMIVHVGMSGLGARHPGGQGIRLDVADPMRWDPVAARYPSLNIMLAHLGWPWLDASVAMALHKTNIYMDISGWGVRHLPADVVREMKRRLSHQITFGTDYPMFDPAKQLDDLSQLELDDAVFRRLTNDNIERFLEI